MAFCRYAIGARLPIAHLLQLLVAFGQLYGDVLYFWGRHSWRGAPTPTPTHSTSGATLWASTPDGQSHPGPIAIQALCTWSMLMRSLR